MIILFNTNLSAIFIKICSAQCCISLHFVLFKNVQIHFFHPSFQSFLTIRFISFVNVRVAESNIKRESRTLYVNSNPWPINLILILNVTSQTTILNAKRDAIGALALRALDIPQQVATTCTTRPAGFLTNRGGFISDGGTTKQQVNNGPLCASLAFSKLREPHFWIGGKLQTTKITASPAQNISTKES